MNIQALLKPLKPTMKWATRNASKLLAAGAIGSEIFGFWLMHREAPIVRDRLEELPEDAKFMDKLKKAGPVYLPAFGMLLLSCGCIVGGCAHGERKAAMISSLYAASEMARRSQEKHLIEELGAEKAQEFHDKVARDILKEKPLENSIVYATGKGDQVFYEPLSGRYFTSSKLEVEKAANEINKTILNDMWVDMNEWYSVLNLEPVGLGESFGWNVDNNVKIYFSTDETPDDRACYVIGYYNRPVLYDGRER